jgi:hypothetical protein
MPLATKEVEHSHACTCQHLKRNTDHAHRAGREPPPTVQPNVFCKQLLPWQNVVDWRDGRPHFAHTACAPSAPLTAERYLDVLVINGVQNERRRHTACATSALKHVDARVNRSLAFIRVRSCRAGGGVRRHECDGGCLGMGRVVRVRAVLPSVAHRASRGVRATWQIRDWWDFDLVEWCELLGCGGAAG